MNAETSLFIPGLDDLLIPTRKDVADPARVSKAVENVRLPVLQGISAIGTLLFHFPQSEYFGDVESCRNAIADIGALLETLGEFAQQLDYMAVNVQRQQTTQALAGEQTKARKAKGGRHERD